MSVPAFRDVLTEARKMEAKDQLRLIQVLLIELEANGGSLAPTPKPQPLADAQEDVLVLHEDVEDRRVVEGTVEEGPTIQAKSQEEDLREALDRRHRFDTHTRDHLHRRSQQHAGQHTYNYRICYRCRKPGHLAGECRERQGLLGAKRRAPY